MKIKTVYNTLSLSLHRAILPVMLAFILPLSLHSQTAPPGTSRKPITASFLFADVEYQDMAVISNVLKVKNNNGKDYTFSINLSLPTGWRAVNKPERTYTVAPNDSVFIPVRILTSNKAARGGVKYNINAFVSSNEGKQMAVAGFMAGRPKISNWQMHILPRPRIYFLNGEDAAPFQLNVVNDGDENEQLILSMSKIGKDFMVADTTKKFLKKNFMEINLEPFSDTTIPFMVTIQKPQRNFKRIDTYGYVPNMPEREKRFGVFFKTMEIGVKPGKSTTISKKADFVKLANSVDFVKLNNITQVNPHGGSAIPLTMIANINNVLGQQPIMNVIFMGNTALDKKSRMEYFLQSGFTYYKYDKRTLSGTNGILSYYHEKGFVSVGSGVGLNFGNLRGISNGKGISGGYNINKNHTVGAYFVRNGITFLNPISTSAGAAYAVKFRTIGAGVGIDHTNFTSGATANSVNANIFSPI